MIHQARLVALSALVLLAVAPLALAQDASPVQPGTVSGRITADGEPAAGVPVRLPWSDPIMNHPRPLTAVTDSEGRYRVEGVPPGRYFLSPFKPGYVGPFYGSGYAGKHGAAVQGPDPDIGYDARGVIGAGQGS